MDQITQAPVANLFILGGLVFLGIAVVGKVVGRIEPTSTGRIMSGIVGVILIVVGTLLQFPPQRSPVGRNPAPVEPRTPPENLTKELDTDRYGNDYRNIPNVSYEQCREACLEYDHCLAYTYDNNPDSIYYKVCFLKNPTPTPSRKAGDISGVKRP